MPSKTSTPESILNVGSQSMEFPMLPGVSINDKGMVETEKPRDPLPGEGVFDFTTGRWLVKPAQPTVQSNPNPASLKGTMDNQPTGVQTASVDTEAQPAVLPPSTPQPPVQTSPYQFSQYLDTMSQKLKDTNTLADARGKLITALYDRPLSQEEAATLPPNVAKAIASGDKKAIELQIRLLNDQIKGRTNTLDSSVKFLADEYRADLDAADKKRQEAINTVLQFSQQFGSQASQAMRSLYGDKYVDELKSYGVDIDNLNLPYSLTEREKFGGTSQLGTPVGTINDLPTYNTALTNPGMNRPNRNNNPGNVKVSAWSKSLPGVVGVEANPAADGGYFLIFDSPQSGINAISELLKVGKSYQKVDADTAMKRYSGGGYGAEAVGLDPKQDFQTQIADPAKLQAVITALTKREGFTGVGGATTMKPFFGLNKDVYNAGATIANNFRQEQPVKDFNIVQNKYQTVGKIIDQGVGGPGDLALVFEFMKALDPNSVVRETEYETAAKSGNIFAGTLAKFNGYLKAEGGFLPDNVKQAFKDIVDTKFTIAKAQYDNLFNEYSRKIDSAIGQEGKGNEFLIDYSKAFPASSNSTYTADLDAIFNSMQ